MIPYITRHYQLRGGGGGGSIVRALEECNLPWARSTLSAPLLKLLKVKSKRL